MRYNPSKDCSVYFEWPDIWELKPWFAEPPRKKKKPKLPKPWEVDLENPNKQKTISYWRDYAKKGKNITKKDLQFDTWPEHNRKDPEETMLPFGGNGSRFIKVTMGFPLGFVYRPMPKRLDQVMEIKNKKKPTGKQDKGKNGKKKGKGGKKGAKK